MLLSVCSVLLSACSIAVVLPAGAAADQASDPGSAAAGRLAAGGVQTCAIRADGGVACWGYGGDGELGYGNTNDVGLDDTPASAGVVDLGSGHTAVAIAAGQYHTCAILDDATVRCWGFGGNGRLGYGNTTNVGDTPATTPASAGPVSLGSGRTAKAITAGSGHTCAILDNGSVLCWGYGGNGRLGYGNTNDVGATASTMPGEVGPVDLGGHAAKAISAGMGHTCAILDDGSVLCWGYGRDGELGYGNTNNVGDTQTPGSVGPVNLGGHTATAISAGGRHTCVILDDGSVRCWGYNGTGGLGDGSTASLGQTPATTPDQIAPVDLGPGRAAVAISAGLNDSCALLDNGSVLCWGYGLDGRLGYGNESDVGDTPATLPGIVGPVDLGPGRTAVAITAGDSHTCATLDNGSVRCWGNGADGRLGYCGSSNVGDTPDTLPGLFGPVNLLPGDGGLLCPPPAPAPGQAPPTPPPIAPSPGPSANLAAAAQAKREAGFHACLARARHVAAGHARRGARRRCVNRYARTPGPVAFVGARAASRIAVVLSFAAAGSDGSKPPPARGYLVEEFTRPVRAAQRTRGGLTLCHSDCRFDVTAVGERIDFTITHLRPHHTYYYTVAARDNVTGRAGPASRPVAVRTP